MNEPLSLRDLVQQALTKRGGSGRSLAAAAERAGHKVTHTTVNQLAAGTYRFKPAPETIRAVAWLAGVSDEVAFAAAGVPMPGPPFSEELPPGVDNLSPRSRRAAVEVLRALVEAEQKAGGEHADRSAPKNPAGGSPAKRAHLTALDGTTIDVDDEAIAASMSVDRADPDDAEAEAGQEEP